MKEQADNKRREERDVEDMEEWILHYYCSVAFGCLLFLVVLEYASS